MRIYQTDSVFEAMDGRFKKIFDAHERVVVSVSSGKDSTLLAHLAADYARRHNRPIEFFFLDQEAEYSATVDQIRHMMTWPGVIPRWYQVPIRMTNSTSYSNDFLCAWGTGEEWIREKEPTSIQEAPGAPDRFYSFFKWLENQSEGSASLIGLRAEEVMRYRAVTQFAAVPGIPWSSKGHGVIKYYPIYDWTFEDVWLYFYRNKVRYNKLYDWLYMKGRRIPEFRVSNLIHESSFQCLELLQEFEPDNYNALVRRLGGVAIAARYAKESSIYQTHKRPKAFLEWSQYRDFLLTTIPEEIANTFRKRFAKQMNTEAVARQQVRQIVTNDWENNRPVKPREDRDPLRKWKEVL